MLEGTVKELNEKNITKSSNLERYRDWKYPSKNEEIKTFHITKAERIVASRPIIEEILKVVFFMSKITAPDKKTEAQEQKFKSL